MVVNDCDCIKHEALSLFVMFCTWHVESGNIYALPRLSRIWNLQIERVIHFCFWWNKITSLFLHLNCPAIYIKIHHVFQFSNLEGELGRLSGSWLRWLQTRGLSTNHHWTGTLQAKHCRAQCSVEVKLQRLHGYWMELPTKAYATSVYNCWAKQK